MLRWPAVAPCPPPSLTACICRRGTPLPVRTCFFPPTHPSPHAKLQVFILPTIRINGVQYRGKMATAEVLRAICAGFSAGNMPQACSKVGAAAATLAKKE